MYLFFPFFSYIVIIRSLIVWFYLYVFIYFIQGRSENHSCENAPCLKIIIIIITCLDVDLSTTFWSHVAMDFHFNFPPDKSWK